MRTPAQLTSAFLSEVRLRTDPEFAWPDASRWNYAIVPEVEIEDPTEAEDGGLEATVHVNVRIDWSEDEEGDEGDEGDEAEEPPFDLHLQVTGYFTWTPRMRPDEDQTARLWLEYNGQWLLWPYVRNYIAMLTGMTNVPPLTIETLRVPDPPDLGQDKSAEPSTSSDPKQASTK